VIENSQLPPRKKNAIRFRIGKLMIEIESEGTRVDNFLGLLIDISLTAKHMRENLGKVVSDAKDIFRIVYNRRAEDERRNSLHLRRCNKSKTCHRLWMMTMMRRRYAAR
jgi:hypothetical protein